jgi:hypothetical protein
MVGLARRGRLAVLIYDVDRYWKLIYLFLNHIFSILCRYMYRTYRDVAMYPAVSDTGTMSVAAYEIL